MEDKKLYSVAATFNTPDEIIIAADKVANSGYTKYDVNTPYPVHGMDAAMKMPSSKLGYVALIVGLSAALGAFIFMWYISDVNYPLIIGGKPHFSPPAFVPIIFEITVLSASLATVFAMLFFFFKLPNNQHPLHDTDYMKRVSSDKYGINIQSDDPKFDYNDVINLLTNLGAENIQDIYYDEEEVNTVNKVFEPKFLGFLATVFLITSATVYFIFNILLFMPPFDFMVDQFKRVPQEKSTFFDDGFGMRKPVEGAVAQGFAPYEYVNDQKSAAENLTNPLLPSIQNLEKGKERFDTFCSPCHGYHAEGDSRLRGNFPNPPSLHTEKVRNWTDGDIYHVITVGQNIMPGYRTQIKREDRWAIILYVRALQRSLNAKETDIK